MGIINRRDPLLAKTYSIDGVQIDNGNTVP